jgi:hypothetical protein
MLNSAIDFIETVLFFDWWNSLFILLFFVIKKSQKISIVKCVAHSITIAALVHFINLTLNFPMVSQVIYLIVISLYFSILFKTKLLQTSKVVLQALILMLVIEGVCFILYSLLSVDIKNIENVYLNFATFIPVLLVKFSFLFLINKRNSKKELI